MSHYGCDESRCVSKGLSNLFNGSFTCYGDEDGEFYPMMCADGFLPVVVDDPSSEAMAEAQGSSSMHYFTCCPPQQKRHAAAAPRRQCSDPITAPVDDPNSENICENHNNIFDHPSNSRTHPRKMKANMDIRNTFFGDLATPHRDSFLCCDEDENDGEQNHYQTNNSSSILLADDFLEDTECVPYRNEYYHPARVHNQLGSLPLMSCDFSNGDFSIPRSIDNSSSSSSSSSGQYQCCRAGPSLNTIFVEDSTFKITLYLPIAFYYIAAAVSTIVFFGLLIPLLIQLRNGSYQKAVIRGRVRRSAAAKTKSKVYSTYSLYLVYQALFDIVCYVFFIVLYSITLNQKFYPNFTTTLISPPPNVESVPLGFLVLYSYMVASVWMNGFIIYQLLELLRASKSSRRVRLLSLRRVNLQAGLTLAIALSSGIGLYFHIVAIRNELNNESTAEYTAVVLARYIWSVSVVVLPILYSFYASFLIWWRGYMSSMNGSTASARAYRDLAIYFFRIIMVFFGIWIPGLLVTGYASTIPNAQWGFVFVNCLWASQPVISFCVILTKSDARQYIWDLVTLSYFLGGSKEIYDTQQYRGNEIRMGDGNRRTQSTASLTATLTASARTTMTGSVITEV